MCLVSAAGKGRDPRRGGGGQKAEKPSLAWIRELSGCYLSPALLQGLLLRAAPSYFPSARLSSPRGWLGPVSPSCSWVESSWSPVSADTRTASPSKPRPRSAALCVGSGADAAGISALPPGSHLGQGAGALRLRLIPRHLLPPPPPPHNVAAGMVLCPEGICDAGSWKDAREGECRSGTGSFLAWCPSQGGCCGARL